MFFPMMAGLVQKPPRPCLYGSSMRARRAVQRVIMHDGFPAGQWCTLPQSILSIIEVELKQKSRIQLRDCGFQSGQMCVAGSLPFQGGRMGLPDRLEEWRDGR